MEMLSVYSRRFIQHSKMLVSSRFAETRLAEIRVRGWCLPDSPKPDSPKPVSPKPVSLKPISPKLGFMVRVRVVGLGVRVGVSANRVSAKRV